MSFHNHEGEEYNKRFGVKERQQAEKLFKAIEAQADKAQQSFDEDVKKDLLFLERMKEFDLNENNIRFIKHLVSLPDGKGMQGLLNYIQSRTGSAIAHYENKFINGMPLGKFNERNT